MAIWGAAFCSVIILLASLHKFGYRGQRSRENLDLVPFGSRRRCADWALSGQWDVHTELDGGAAGLWIGIPKSRLSVSCFAGFVSGPEGAAVHAGPDVPTRWR